jgi:RNA 2',3'-cyclic 3'-phosphodiesterase
MRLFVGLPLASGTLKELSEAVSRLKASDDVLRWTSPDSWHITLQFLGNTDQKHYECVLARLAEIHAAPVQVRLGNLGFFDRAGVFFVDVVSSAELVGLVETVTAVTGKCGFLGELRPYHPHITLARAKGERAGRSLKALHEHVSREARFTGFRATEFLLYESHTMPGGAKYEVRGRYSLRAAS